VVEKVVKRRQVLQALVLTGAHLAQILAQLDELAVALVLMLGFP